MKKALALTSDPEVIASICHNLAVINYYEIQYHNDTLNDDSKEQEQLNKFALVEQQLREEGREDQIKNYDPKTGRLSMRVADIAESKQAKQLRKEKLDSLRIKLKEMGVDPDKSNNKLLPWNRKKHRNILMLTEKYDVNNIFNYF